MHLGYNEIQGKYLAEGKKEWDESYPVFFLTSLPPGQDVDMSTEVTGEAVEGGWFTPHEMVVPPTRYALEMITGYPTLEELRYAFRPPCSVK